MKKPGSMMTTKQCDADNFFRVSHHSIPILSCRAGNLSNSRSSEPAEQSFKLQKQPAGHSVVQGIQQGQAIWFVASHDEHGTRVCRSASFMHSEITNIDWVN